MTVTSTPRLVGLRKGENALGVRLVSRGVGDQVSKVLAVNYHPSVIPVSRPARGPAALPAAAMINPSRELNCPRAEAISNPVVDYYL